MIKSFLEQFLFFPNTTIKKTPMFHKIEFEDVLLENKKNNDKYNGWFITSNQKNSISKNKTILFFHGNAGNISFCLGYIKAFYDMGFSVLIFDYPSFGNSTGTPCEESCLECSSVFYDYLVNEKCLEPNNIILYGESIGSSIACLLANKYNCKYLVLQSGFTDIKEIIKKIIHLNPYILLNSIGFETEKQLQTRHKINKLQKKMKTMIIHSQDDELIDCSHAEILSKYADKLYICSGSHSNISMDNDFVFELYSFIKED